MTHFGRSRLAALHLVLLQVASLAPPAAVAQSSQRGRTEQGREVILHDNGTWTHGVAPLPAPGQTPAAQPPTHAHSTAPQPPSAPQPLPAPQPPAALSPQSIPARGSLGPIERPRDATASITLRRGNFRFWYNPVKWRPAHENADGRVQLQLTGSEAYIVIIPEGTPVPIAQLKTLAFENASQSGSDARIASETMRTLGGRQVLSLQINVTVNNTPVVFIGYYFGDPRGSIQVVGYASERELARLRAQIVEGLDGLDLNR